MKKIKELLEALSDYTDDVKFVRKDTDYGAYRELAKQNGRIIGWIEQRPEGDLEESGKFFYAYGKPSQSNYISFTCDTLEQAKKEFIENL
jgi:hypothetical protein